MHARGAARLLDKAECKKQNKISEKIMALSESMCFHKYIINTQ